MIPSGFFIPESFIELGARARVQSLLDAGSFRELLGPFDRLESPWLTRQGIVAQSDDGVVIARGTLGNEPVLVCAIESAFQGGGIGEVGGQKIAAALDLALRDRLRTVLLLETGGVRLQEANLGLAVISEIHAGIVALRRHVPVVGVIAGMVGCFGGMSLAAGLCSSLVMTRQGRLGMNGPEVIEQEAGIDELDASDRRRVWQLIGGEQRVRTGLADVLVDDDIDAIRAAVAQAERPAVHRTEKIEAALARLSTARLSAGGHLMATHGARWFGALAGPTETEAPVWSADATLGDERARFIAVVPDPANPFPRARENVVGLEQGWLLARAVRETMALDADRADKRPIVAVVDVKSQAYGAREEMMGIHLACAAAVDAYASARNAGHPVIALLVGPAMSGAFLAHGYQANRILALDGPDTMVHAMGREAAARVTRRTIAELDALAETIAPMSYKLGAFAELGLLDRLLPGDATVAAVSEALGEAVADTRRGARTLAHRLDSPAARKSRAASIEVRRRMVIEWEGS